MADAHANQPVSVLSQTSHDFDDRGLHYHVSHAGCNARELLVDPAPAYPHDVGLAQTEFDRLKTIAPLPFPLACFLLSHEQVSRSNGVYYDEYIYKDGEQIDIGGVKRYPPAGFIVLSAKRIPIHPAMTRYLVPHEYGHGVMYHLARLRGLDDSKLLTQYREECRPDGSHGYGCGHWHSNIGELFANDFRILVAEREIEFWPHLGHKRPDENLAVVGFWARAVKELLA